MCVISNVASKCAMWTISKCVPMCNRQHRSCSAVVLPDSLRVWVSMMLFNFARKAYTKHMLNWISSAKWFKKASSLVFLFPFLFQHHYCHIVCDYCVITKQSIVINSVSVGSPSFLYHKKKIKKYSCSRHSNVPATLCIVARYRATASSRPFWTHRRLTTARFHKRPTNAQAGCT